MDFSIAQLHLLRSLKNNGWEANSPMLEILLNRCGAIQQDWDLLSKEGLICNRANRYWLTTQGKKTFKKVRKGRYF